LQVDKTFETKEAAAAAMEEAYGDRSSAHEYFHTGAHAAVVEKVQQDHGSDRPRGLAGYQIDMVRVVDETAPATKAEKRQGMKRGPATGKYIVTRSKALRATTPKAMYTAWAGGWVWGATTPTTPHPTHCAEGLLAAIAGGRSARLARARVLRAGAGSA
jgi:hypothetical protein